MGIILLLLMVGFLIFLRRKFRAWKTNVKGKISEHLVYHKMLQLSDEYTIFNDLLFESNGYSTQIDHLVVSPYGIFVIETKGYKGWIFGGENTEYWTQSLYGNKYQFYNPIKQNEGHVRYLRYLLRTSAYIPIIPIVVFGNSAEIKAHVTNHIVVNRRHLTRAIRQYQNRVITDDTLRWIVAKIHSSYTVAHKEETKSHKANVEARRYRSKVNVRNGICPDCGGQLVLRRGKYGSFYGCSNYPKCKFTTNR